MCWARLAAAFRLWLCIAAISACAWVAAEADAPLPQLATTAAAGNSHPAAAEVAQQHAAAAHHRSLLQDEFQPVQAPNIQLHPTAEDPVPPTLIDAHQPTATVAAPAAGVLGDAGAEVQSGWVKKGFLVHPVHKQLLPVDFKDVCLFILSFAVLSLAAGAGIGGGVLLVPMLSLITGFSNIQTVALSNVTIFSGAITNMLFNLPRKNPFKGGPIIDYDLLLLFGPPIVMGSIVGSYINYFVPGWVTKTLVLLVLAPMTWRMINKSRLMWLAENRRVSSERQQSGLHWNASDLLGSSPVVGSSLELVVSVPEDKEVSGEVELGRLPVNEAGASPLPAQLEPGESIRQHQMQLAPLATAQHGAPRLSGQQGTGGSVAGASPVSARSAYRPVVHCSASTPHDRDSYGAAYSLQAPSRTHSHANVLAALSDRPPSLADLLGPYFLVLNTPQVADATLQAQALSRQANPIQLQRTNSVTRRHTLDTSLYFKQHGSSTGSRPSSAPTVPSDAIWDAQQRDHQLQTPDCCCSSPVHNNVQAAADSNPLSIISPFQLYQQQRCQHSKQDRLSHAGCEGCAGKQPPCPQPLPVAATDRCQKLVHTCCVHAPELEAKMRRKIHHHATTQVPKAHLSALLLMLAAVTVTSVTATLQLTCGTWEYWIVVLTPLPLMMVVWALMRWHVLWRVGWQQALCMTHPTDIVWTANSTLTYPAIVITVGVMAGMLGLGGGIVLAPLLLELGVQPAVSAASSQAAMLMSSCTSTVVYLVADAVPKDYGIAMAIIGFTGTLFGQIAFNYAVQRTGRSSILVFILAVLFVLASAAAVVVISNSITAIVRSPEKLTMTYAHDICKMRGS